MTMDFLKDNTKPLYFKCLRAAFGSAIIGMIYSIVDMAMAGQYHGPAGSAALAVASPIWNMVYSLGLLMGIGGSVLFSNLRGQSTENRDASNEYFTSATVGVSILALLVWILVGFFDKELLTLFGASESIMPLARSYVRPIKYVIPLFMLNQMLSAFLRNDGNPGLAAKAVLFGGLFNVFGDYFFVFVLDMGIYGAGLATAVGSAFTFLILLAHFFSKKNTLRFVRPVKLFSYLWKICVTGFSTFFY
jgi:Na+-driven multidrug efflux pump